MAVTYITTLNINGSGAGQLFVSGDVSFTGCATIGHYTLPHTDGSSGQVLCTNGSGTVSWGAGGGDSLWADGTNPYIVPCNSCGICLTGNVVTNSLYTHCAGDIGCNSGTSTTYFNALWACCIANPPGISLWVGNGGDYTDMINVACFGTDCTCLAHIRVQGISPRYNAATCSKCIGFSNCRFGEGYVNCLYACRIFKLPVGTNCY